MPRTSLPIASAWSGTPGELKVYSMRHLRPIVQSRRLPMTSGHGAPRFGSRMTIARSSICIGCRALAVLSVSVRISREDFRGQELARDQHPVAREPPRLAPPGEAALPDLLGADRRPL